MNQNIDFYRSAGRHGVFNDTLSVLHILFAVIIILAVLTCPDAVASNNPGIIEIGAPAGPVRDLPAELDVIFGWPRAMIGDAPLWARCPTVADFDGNNDWEIVLLTTEGMIYVYQNDGAHFPGFPMEPHNRPFPWENPRHNSTIATGDVLQDGCSDIVYISDIGYLHLLSYVNDNLEPEPFPLNLGQQIDSGIPALSDVDGDGSLEIVFNVWSNDPDSVNAGAFLHVITAAGDELNGWPVAYPRGSSSSPAVGNIDSDDGVELVIGSARYLDSPAQIHAFYEDGRRVVGFPTGNFQTIHSTTTLVDIDGEAGLEIIFWAADLDGNSGLYALKGDGSILDGFPVECPTGHPEGNVIAADITGDDVPEIIFGTFNPQDGGRIYAWSDHGILLDGFPIQLDRSVIGSVIAGDVDGNHLPDIVACLTPSVDQPGMIVAYDYNAEMVDGFPIDLADYNGGAFAGTPTLWDIDKDRDMDLIAVTTDRRVFIWDTPGRPADNAWLSFKGNMRRDGRYVRRDPNSVPDERVVPIPEELELSAYPNPFNSAVRISVSLDRAQNGALLLTDSQGRLVTEVFNGVLNAGQSTFAVDFSDFNSPAGVYFLQFQGEDRAKSIKLLFVP